MSEILREFRTYFLLPTPTPATTYANPYHLTQTS